MSDPVVVVGDVMVDVVVVPEAPLAPGSDTPADVVSLGGGSAANTACWLAALGVDVALVASVGDDALGRAALDALAVSGVHFAGTVDPDRPTGSCVVLVHPDGERTMLPARGANDALDPAAIDAAVGAATRWVHLSGYALLGTGSHAAAQTAMAAARRRGLPFSVDASSVAPLRSTGPTRFLGWIDGCAVLFGNDEEMGALGGVGAVLESASEVVVKLGAAGASWTDGGRSESSPAVATEVVDTVGAGDAFDAGFLSARIRGDDPCACLHAGTLAAAQAVARRGARPSP